MTALGVLGIVVFCLFTLSVGMICLSRPEAVRDYALRTSPTWNPFRRFMQAKSYIWSIRCCGIIAMLMFALVVVGSIWGRR